MLSLSSFTPTLSRDTFSTSKSYNNNVGSTRLSKVQPCSCSLAKQEVATTTTTTLPEGLKPELMPKHVAVIMDGNRRWAAEKGLPMQQGYREGARAMRQLAGLCSTWGVKVLTVFAFSTENWTRPKEEVNFLMSLFEEVIQTDLEKPVRDGIKVSFIGDKSGLPRTLQFLMNTAEQVTGSNSGFHYIIALNYGGRHDIVRAAKNLATKAIDGLVRVEDIDLNLFAEELETNATEFPDPDLLIRTSGEHRISNFLLWQFAYTELFFSDKLFPEFGEDDFVEALKSFQKRERRYGGYADTDL